MTGIAFELIIYASGAVIAGAVLPVTTSTGMSMKNIGNTCQQHAAVNGRVYADACGECVYRAALVRS
jgi:hypothetical protein